jgi:hypothetical protein
LNGLSAGRAEPKLSQGRVSSSTRRVKPIAWFCSIQAPLPRLMVVRFAAQKEIGPHRCGPILFGSIEFWIRT